MNWKLLVAFGIGGIVGGVIGYVICKKRYEKMYDKIVSSYTEKKGASDVIEKEESNIDIGAPERDPNTGDFTPETIARYVGLVNQYQTGTVDPAESESPQDDDPEELTEQKDDGIVIEPKIYKGADGIYPITPDEYGFDRLTEKKELTYFSGDGYLYDEDNEEIVDQYTTVGPDIRNNIGVYELGVAYIRNTNTDTIYVIYEDERNYADVYGVDGNYIYGD